MKIPSPEPLILFFLAAVTLMIWGFWEIAEDVMEGETHKIDAYILLALRNSQNTDIAWGPVWFQETMRDISGLGGTFILSFFTLCIAAFLFAIKEFRRGFYLIGVVGTGMLIANLLKLGFDRPRPDLVPHGSITYTSSFPSSHSMMSAIVYLILGAMLAQTQKCRTVKIFFMGISILLALLIGISRIYLGVHWPSDVIAGWLAGSVCAFTFWIGENYLFKKQPSARRSSTE